MRYTKPCLTFDDQCQLLKSRGLRVDDDAVVVAALRRISYYRLSAYFPPFRTGDDFAQQACFEDVLRLYDHDRTLRMLLGDGLERIEVYLRTALTYHLALAGGPFAHCDRSLFAAEYEHDRLFEEIRKEENRSSELFTRHFRTKYDEEKELPIWMATELLTFGTLSVLYQGVSLAVQKAIAAPFGLDNNVLRSWFHFLTVVRNTCAHHGRVWDRAFKVKPRIPRDPKRWPFNVDPGSSYCALLVVRDLLKRIDPACTWRFSVHEYLAGCDERQRRGMGVPQEWSEFGVWHENIESLPKG